MRTLLELYNEILNEFDIHYRSYWLCNTIKHSGRLTLDEKDRLLTHFSNQKPSSEQYQEFFNNSRFKKGCSEWWSRSDKSARVEFLLEIIEKLQKDLDK